MKLNESTVYSLLETILCNKCGSQELYTKANFLAGKLLDLKLKELEAAETPDKSLGSVVSEIIKCPSNKNS